MTENQNELPAEPKKSAMPEHEKTKEASSSPPVIAPESSQLQTTKLKLIQWKYTNTRIT